MEWLNSHWDDVLAFIGGVDILLGIVVTWTKAKWDDNLYTGFHNLFVKFFRKSA